jgi:3-methyladenine DNA glycosylase AlkD
MNDSLKLIKELKQFKSKHKQEILSRFFKTGKGEYGEGDLFWGVSVPSQRIIAKRFASLDLKNIALLLEHSVHEVRLTAALLLVTKYQTEKKQLDRKVVTDFYLKKLDRFNNWDLIDLSVYKILGHYLYNYQKSKAIEVLKSLARESSLWRRRAAIVATFYFIRQKSYKETFVIAKILQTDKNDLIHKACGWMLREVGKRVGEDILYLYLDKNCQKMPRVTLRYAIERLSKEKRESYMKA